MCICWVLTDRVCSVLDFGQCSSGVLVTPGFSLGLVSCRLRSIRVSVHFRVFGSVSLVGGFGLTVFHGFGSRESQVEYLAKRLLFFFLESPHLSFSEFLRE